MFNENKKLQPSSSDPIPFDLESSAPALLTDDWLD
jgi:hypothetical protein